MIFGSPRKLPIGKVITIPEIVGANNKEDILRNQPVLVVRSATYEEYVECCKATQATQIAKPHELPYYYELTWD